MQDTTKTEQDVVISKPKTVEELQKEVEFLRNMLTIERKKKESFKAGYFHYKKFLVDHTNEFIGIRDAMETLNKGIYNIRENIPIFAEIYGITDNDIFRKLSTSYYKEQRGKIFKKINELKRLLDNEL